MDKLQVAQDLEAAADYIDQYGWTQKKFKHADGRACIYGAVCQVTGNPYGLSPEPRTDRAMKALHAELNPIAPVTWNDAAGRKKLGVTRLLRKTAKKLRVDA